MERERLKALAKRISRSHGDALAGEKIIAQARNIGRVCVCAGTSSHKIQEVSLRGNVLCVIDRPFHIIEQLRRVKN